MGVGRLQPGEQLARASRAPGSCPGGVPHQAWAGAGGRPAIWFAQGPTWSRKPPCPATLCALTPTHPHQGMRDLGLEQLGAQLSLFGRQVASSISSLLPAELNPFGPDEEVGAVRWHRWAVAAGYELRRAALMPAGPHC